MHILLVIDSKDGFDKKIEVLQRQFPSAEYKIFVNKSFEDLTKEDFIKDNLFVVYNDDLQYQFNKCIAATNDSVLVYYISAYADDKVFAEMKQQIIDGSKCVYVKQRRNVFWDFLQKIYNLIMMLILGSKDRLASIKIQYIDAEIVQLLTKIGFKFRILDGFEVKSSELYYDKPQSKTLNIEKKIKKSNYINLTLLIIFIALTIVLGVLLTMPFWVWVLLICVVISLAFTQIMVAVKNIFDERIR